MQQRPTVLQRLERLKALVPGDTPNYARRLSSALRDRSERIRAEALSLAREHEVTACVSQVEVCLKEKSALNRCDAALCLSDLLPLGTAHAGMRALLDDPDWMVRIDAMESLEALEDSRALPQIARLLHDENAIVRSYCGAILAEMSGSRYLRQLERVRAKERDSRAMPGLLQGLFLAGRRDVLPDLLALLSDEEYTVRCSVINTLPDLEVSVDEHKLIVQTLKKLQREETTIAVKSEIPHALKKLRAKTSRS